MVRASKDHFYNNIILYKKTKDEVLYRNVSKCICFYIDVVFLFVAPLEPNIIVGVAL